MNDQSMSEIATLEGEVQLLRARIATARSRHTEYVESWGKPATCFLDREPWPCRTVRDLDGTHT